MKIFGHPVHLMLVHFPSALFPMDLICSLAANYVLTDQLVNTSAFAMLGGTAFGWLAAITGMFDLIGVSRNKPASVKKALIHGSINSVVLIGYTLLSLIFIKNLPEFIKDSGTVLTIKIFLVLLLIVGNFIGGSLVLEDKVLDKK